jgi:hypothetical protein
MPSGYRAEALIPPARRATSPVEILLPHADVGRQVIADELRKQGAQVVEVVAYRTVATDPEREGQPDVYACSSRAASMSSRSRAVRGANMVSVLGQSRQSTCFGRRSSPRLGL